ncbi:hypothetical protein KKG81_12990 [bacterium]|nr:hypothetical protein [bacterium]
MKRKFPFFLGPYGEVGAFRGKVTIESEPDLVRIQYVPLNSIRVKQTHYAVREDAVLQYSIPNQGIEGAQDEYVVITENVDGNSPFFDKINRIQAEKISEYKERLSDDEFENRMTKQRLLDARDSDDRKKHKENERRTIRDRGYPFFRGPSGSSFVGSHNYESEELDNEIEDI